MKTILSIIFTAIITITFTACGGGGGGDSSFKQTTVNITVACTTVSPAVPSAGDIATYQEVFSGDSIVKDTGSTIVQIYTPIGSNSRVCLQSGSAHIVRK